MLDLIQASMQTVFYQESYYLAEYSFSILLWMSKSYVFESQFLKLINYDN